MSDFKWNEEKQTFEVAKVGLVELAKKKLDNLDLSNVVVDSDETYQRVWQARTEINALVKDLSSKRKQMEAIVLSAFKPTCVEVEKYGVKISDKLTALLNAYKPKEKRKTPVFKIVIKTEDLKVVKKFENMALKYGCVIQTEEQ